MNECDAYRGNETILVVDDEKQLRDFLSIFLSSLGYNTLFAENGNVAVDKYSQHSDSISLTIMDIMMPEKDGITALNEIKAIYPDANILLASGYHQDTKLIEYHPKVQIISKPYSSLELAKKIREHLDY